MPETRFWHLVERLHGLGPRAVGELLAEIGAVRFCRHAIEQRLEAYCARLDPALLRAVGGDKVPPTPAHAVLGAGRHAAS